MGGMEPEINYTVKLAFFLCWRKYLTIQLKRKNSPIYSIVAEFFWEEEIVTNSLVLSNFTETYCYSLEVGSYSERPLEFLWI